MGRRGFQTGLEQFQMVSGCPIVALMNKPSGT